MTRLRYSFEGALARAEQLAKEFAGRQTWGPLARCVGAAPAALEPQGSCSKHPTVWHVCFVFHAPDVAMDGGELFVLVDLETEAVSVLDL
ncbi:MAG: hypothetical protein JWM11_5238 [Planctomycetaceae bacterium]|nr:hypothetical protein [Planctomycetaceae bacterium]